MEPFSSTGSNDLLEPLLNRASAVDHPDDRSVDNAANADAPPVPGDNHKRHHRNIPVMLSFQFIRCGAEAIWLGSVLSAYVYLLRPDKPELVGYLSAVEGITQFVAACAAGVLADRYFRRDLLCRMASLIGVVASLLIVTSCTQHVLWCLIVALACNGAFDGINLTASLAVFADALADGPERAQYFAYRDLATSLGQCLGPLFGLVMFYHNGDQWTLQACAKVTIAAQVLLSPAFVLLWFFRDVEEEEQSHTAAAVNNDDEYVAHTDDEAGAEQTEAQLVANDTTGENTAPLLLHHPTSNTEMAEGTIANSINASGDSSHPDASSSNRCGVSRARWIAVSAAASDVLGAFANGVSFRYFAIFFLKDLHFNPVLVQALDAVSCLIGGGLLVGAQRISVPYGRCPTTVAFKAVGVCFLLAMVLSYQYWHDGGSASSNLTLSIVICGLYLTQNAFLNSTSALTRSLIMDHVPSHERARWSALESINIFGWCGSSAVGGVVVKICGGNILPVFYLMAILQVVGLLPLVALFGVESKPVVETTHSLLQRESANEEENDQE